jgi:hypothetical protein|tara:strand:+ start:131 stop:406 length:276 start_codon:yes stop_codon:yes gene_type:complete
MDKKLERNIIWTLAVLLLVLGLTGCAMKPLTVISKPIEEKLLLTDTISNMPAIAEILGCMFAPNRPNCDKELKDKPLSALTNSNVEEIIED